MSYDIAHLRDGKLEFALEEPWHVERESTDNDGQEVLKEPPSDGIGVVHSLLVVQGIVHRHVPATLNV